MIKIGDFNAVQLEVPAQERPIVGLLPGMELIGHNLPTNNHTEPRCLIKWNNYVRECLLVLSGENFEPLEVPEKIYSLAAFQNAIPLEARLEAKVSAEQELLSAFDEALELQPFLMFELGYTRVTDWMVHVWNKSGGGPPRKVVTTQHPDRSECCRGAAEKLRHLMKFGDPLLR